MTHRAGTGRLTRTAVAALLALGLTACGGDDDPAEPEATVADSTSSPPSQSGTPASSSTPEQEGEEITASLVDFAVELDEDSLSAGSYQIEVVNEGGSPHNLVVERDGEDVAAVDAIDPGQTATLTVTLEPGEYVFYCAIGNHRAMGMEISVQVT